MEENGEEELDCTGGLGGSSAKASKALLPESPEVEDEVEEVEEPQDPEEVEVAGLHASERLRAKAKPRPKQVAPPSWQSKGKFDGYYKGGWKGWKGKDGMGKDGMGKGYGKGFAKGMTPFSYARQVHTPRMGLRPPRLRPMMGQQTSYRPRVTVRPPNLQSPNPNLALEDSTENSDKPSEKVPVTVEPPANVKPPSLRPPSLRPSLRPPMRPRGAPASFSSSRRPQHPASRHSGPRPRHSAPHYSTPAPPSAGIATMSIRLSGLPQWWSHRDVEGLCSQHGLVTNIDMADNGICLVTFQMHVAAQTAARAMDNMQVPGGSSFIRCELFDATTFEVMKKSLSEQPAEPLEKIDLPPHINLFVDELQLTTGEARPEDCEVFLRDLPVQDCDEEELRKWLAGFGKTEHVSFLVHPDSNKLTGSAYVRFSQHSEAVAVIDAFPIDSVGGNVQASWSLSERIGQGTEGHLKADVLGDLIGCLGRLRAEMKCASLTLIGASCKGRPAIGKFSFDVLEGPLRFAWLRKDVAAISESLRSQLTQTLQSALSGEKKSASVDSSALTAAENGQQAAEGASELNVKMEERKRRKREGAASGDEAAETPPRILVRGFPASWQEQQLKLVFALFGGTESVTFEAGVSGDREAQVQLKDTSQTVKVAERLHNTQVGDGELIETCQIYCEALSGRRRKHRKKDRHAVAPAASAEQAVEGKPTANVPEGGKGMPSEIPAGKGFPPAYGFPPFAPPSWPGTPGYGRPWGPYPPHPQYGYPPPGYPFSPPGYPGPAPSERPDKKHEGLPSNGALPLAPLPGEQSGAPLTESDQLVKKQLARGMMLIKKGQTLAEAGVLEEANANYVRGIQKILKMDQSHPLVAGVQKKLSRYVDEAEKLQQRLDRASEPSPVGHIEDEARSHRHQEDPRHRRRKAEVRQWGVAEPAPIDERGVRHDDLPPRHSHSSHGQRRTRVRRQVDRSRSRDEYIPRHSGHSMSDDVDEGLTLKPRVKLVPRGR